MKDYSVNLQASAPKKPIRKPENEKIIRYLHKVLDSIDRTYINRPSIINEPEITYEKKQATTIQVTDLDDDGSSETVEYAVVRKNKNSEQHFKKRNDFTNKSKRDVKPTSPIRKKTTLDHPAGIYKARRATIQVTDLDDGLTENIEYAEEHKHETQERAFKKRTDATNKSKRVNIKHPSLRKRNKQINAGTEVDVQPAETAVFEDKFRTSTPILVKVKSTQLPQPEKFEVRIVDLVPKKNKVSRCLDQKPESTPETKKSLAAARQSFMSNLVEKEIKNLKLNEQKIEQSSVDALHKRYSCTNNNNDSAFMGSPQLDRNTNEKFVVNLFESRNSKRWKRQTEKLVYRAPECIQDSMDRMFVEDLNSSKRHAICRTPEKFKETLETCAMSSVDSALNATNTVNSSIDRATEIYSAQFSSQDITDNENTEENTLTENTYTSLVDVTNVPNTTQLIQQEPIQSFIRLKSARDIECEKMKQATKAINSLKSNKTDIKNYKEVLVAEKILLESGENYKNLMEQLRDANYSEIGLNHYGSIGISNLKFGLNPLDEKRSKDLQFYVCVASSGKDVKVSDIVAPLERPGEECITFGDSFNFKSLDSNFVVDLKVYAITFKHKTTLETALSYLNMKPKIFCPTDKVIYKNVHTFEAEESDILKTSFKLCGHFQVRKGDIGEKILNGVTVINSRLKNEAHVTSKVDTHINAHHSGFLSVGVQTAAAIYWDLKYCVLENDILKIYNSPSEVPFVPHASVHKVDLKACCNDMIEEVNYRVCSRKKTFSMSFAKPEGGRKTVLFSPKTKEEFEDWKCELNNVLGSLKSWSLMPYLDTNV